MWRISVNDLNITTNLCRELGLNIDDYKNTCPEKAGKLIFDLCKIKLMGLGDLKAGKTAPPNPKDYE